MCEDKILKEPYAKQIRSSFTETLAIMYPDSTSLRAAANYLGVSYETARQARDYGKGSVETLVGLVIHGLNIPPQSLEKNLPKVLKMFDKSGELTILEKLIQEVAFKYGHHELIAWLRLLSARFEIENELGIKRKPQTLKRQKILNNLFTKKVIETNETD